MEIPGIGPLVESPDMGWLESDEVELAVFDGAEVEVIIQDPADYKASPEAYHATAANLLAAGPEVLRAAEEHIWRYYRDCYELQKEAGMEPVEIASPADLWSHINFGCELVLSRESGGEQRVHASLSSNCDWEVEHGLHVSLREGSEVVKVGPFDGHVTNADAYADPSLAGVIYKPMR